MSCLGATWWFVAMIVIHKNCASEPDLISSSPNNYYTIHNLKTYMWKWSKDKIMKHIQTIEQNEEINFGVKSKHQPYFWWKNCCFMIRLTDLVHQLNKPSKNLKRRILGSFWESSLLCFISDLENRNWNVWKKSFCCL